MAVWFISDLHIGHRLVAVTRFEVDGKPIWQNGEPLPEWFGDYEVARHDEILAQQWDSCVDNDDTVWVLGDISGGSDKSVYAALQWIQDRPGIKRLIHGNHDPINGLHRDAYKWERPFLHAFESTHAYIRRRVPNMGEGHTDIVLSHFPYVDKSVGIGRAARFNTYRLQDNGIPVVHGHTHSKEKVTYSEAGTLQLHVGVDAWGPSGSLCPLDWIVREVQGWVARETPAEREIATESAAETGGAWQAMA